MIGNIRERWCSGEAGKSLVVGGTGGSPFKSQASSSEAATCNVPIC